MDDEADRISQRILFEISRAIISDRVIWNKYNNLTGLFERELIRAEQNDEGKGDDIGMV